VSAVEVMCSSSESPCHLTNWGWLMLQQLRPHIGTAVSKARLDTALLCLDPSPVQQILDRYIKLKQEHGAVLPSAVRALVVAGRRKLSVAEREAHAELLLAEHVELSQSDSDLLAAPEYTAAIIQAFLSTGRSQELWGYVEAMNRDASYASTLSVDTLLSILRTDSASASVAALRRDLSRQLLGRVESIAAELVPFSVLRQLLKVCAAVKDWDTAISILSMQERHIVEAVSPLDSVLYRECIQDFVYVVGELCADESHLRRHHELLSNAIAASIIPKRKQGRALPHYDLCRCLGHFLSNGYLGDAIRIVLAMLDASAVNIKHFSTRLLEELVLAAMCAAPDEAPRMQELWAQRRRLFGTSDHTASSASPVVCLAESQTMPKGVFLSNGLLEMNHCMYPSFRTLQPSPHAAS
jgi:hypothetical protein